MAITFTREKQDNSFKGNAGFTYTTEDGGKGFGFICPTEDNSVVLTVIAAHEGSTMGRLSEVVSIYDLENFCTIDTFLGDYFDCRVFVKAYKRLEDMNIIVDLGVK